MEHPRDLREFFYNADAVLVGFPLMDDDGQIQFPRQRHLGAERRLLALPRDVLVMVVKANLTDGPDFGIQFT